MVKLLPHPFRGGYLHQCGSATSHYFQRGRWAKEEDDSFSVFSRWWVALRVEAMTDPRGEACLRGLLSSAYSFGFPFTPACAPPASSSSCLIKPPISSTSRVRYAFTIS